MTCLFFIFPANVHSKVIEYKNYILKENKYSLTEVCKSLTKRDSPLIDIDSISHINCMGKSLDVSVFCSDKEITNPYFTKAFISKKDKKVVCQSAKRVIVKYECSKEDFDKYCKDKELGCFLIKEKMAKRLSLAHSGLEKKILSCYFGIRDSLSL